MANELAHTPLVADADGFVRLRQTDYESLTAHKLNNGVAGDGVGYDGSKLVRVAQLAPATLFGMSTALADNGAALQSAIDAVNGVIVPAGNYNMATGVTLPRNKRLRLDPGAILTWTPSSGTMITISDPTDSGWRTGGVVGSGHLVGGGGTSVGVQLGNSTNYAHGVLLQGMEIDTFYAGVKWAGSGQAFLSTLDHCHIHGNTRGLWMNASAENLRVIGGAIFDNTKAGIYVDGAAIDLTVIGTSLDNNGDATLGQIYSGVNTSLVLTCLGVHFEWSSGTETLPHIYSAGVGTGHVSQIKVIGGEMLAGGGTATQPFIRMIQGTLTLSGVNFSGIENNSTALILLGDSNQNEVRIFGFANNISIVDSAGANPYYVYLNNTVSSNKAVWLGNKCSGSAASPAYNWNGVVPFTDDVDYITRNTGLASIPKDGASTYVDWPHGCSATPSSVLVTPQETGSSTPIVPAANIGATNFRIQIPAAVAKATAALGSAQAYAASAYTDETTVANNATANDMNLLPAAPAINDAYLFGASEPFCGVDVNIGQQGAGTWTITWEYWNGSTWSTLLVTDGTSGFTAAVGTRAVTFSGGVPSDWAKTTINAVSAYYIRARVSAFTSITTQPLGTQGWVHTALHFLWRAEL